MLVLGLLILSAHNLIRMWRPHGTDALIVYVGWALVFFGCFTSLWHNGFIY